jgi:Tn3 transposase DDE domain
VRESRIRSPRSERIICWNYLYLSHKLAEIDDPVKREEFLKAVAHGSAAAWEHVNLLGEYDLSEENFKRLGRNQAPKTDRLTGWSPWELQN